MLLDGQYVQVRGVLTAEGAIRATGVKLRDGRNEAEAELKGSVDAYDAATQRFSVRGVSVDASRLRSRSARAACSPTGCTSASRGRSTPPR